MTRARVVAWLLACGMVVARPGEAGQVLAPPHRPSRRHSRRTCRSRLPSTVLKTLTPVMFVSALLQYNASGHAVSTNVRLRWEYQPGSELFVVRGFPDLKNRAVIVKINRVFRL